MSVAPLVSVITIFLNEDRFLREAIESVVAQTSDRWELLLIDDGSTDGSSEIARQYSERDPDRIRYFTHEGGRNRGKSVSRNLGLHVARGEYVTFLDGDDVLRPEKIERQAALLSERPEAMVCGRTLYWWTWEGAPPAREPDFESMAGLALDRSYPPPSLLALFLRDGRNVPCICGAMVRRSVALHVGGFDESIHYMYEDQVFLAKICARFPVFIESGCWEQYRQHARSTSHQAIQAGTYHPVQPNPSEQAFLSWLEEYVCASGTSDAELRAALDRSWWRYRHPTLYRWQRRMLRLQKRAAESLDRLLRPARAGDSTTDRP